jgi:nucleoside-diphosphate-sugar epimerase
MFAAMAYTTGKIVLNSDGQAWRPFVHVQDISQAIKYGIEYKSKKGQKIILNVGTTSQNYQILELAKMVQAQIPGCKVSFLGQTKDVVDNELIKDRKIQDGVDSRNYKISFEKIQQIFPEFKSEWTVEKGIKEMLNKFKQLQLNQKEFENINYYRLQQLEWLIKNGYLTQDLRWIKTYN